MSTIKISQLVPITLNANTNNTLLVGVDIPTTITGKLTTTALAQGLYSNNPLTVGINQILYPNTIAQFSGNSVTYLQTNFQNYTPSGSADVVLTSDVGTNSNNYIDLGINNSQYSDPSFSSMYPLDGYLYVSGPNSTSNSGNLVIGTSSYGANINFIAGGTTNNDIISVFNEDIITFYEPVNISHVPYDADDSYIPAFVISNYGNSYSLLVNDETSDTSPFVIDASGNVAVGTLNSQQYKLNVAGSIATTNGYYFADGTKQTTAVSNTWVSANDTVTLTSAKSYTDTANTFLQSYAVANTTNINLPGNLTVQSNLTINGITTHTGPIVTGNIIVNGTTTSNGTSNLIGNVIIFGSETINGFLTVNNSTFATNTPMVKLVASNSGATVAPTTTDYILHITGKDSMPARVVVDAFGSNSYPLLAGRAGRGTADAPTNSSNNDILMRIGGLGYANGFTQLGVSRIDMVAGENYTTSSKGSRIEFWNTPNGSNTINKIASFNAADVTFTGAVQPQKGFIYTPTVYPTAQTAITVDFANNSVIRATTTSGLTVSFTNYTVGKVVDMWITNTSGFSQTFTHGVSALNSTTNATTYSIPSTSTIYVKYMCFDGDLANTFVAITHA